MLAARDLQLKPVAQTVESKLVTGAPVDFSGAFKGSQFEPSASENQSQSKGGLVQIPFKPEYTTQPVAKPTASIMKGAAGLYDAVNTSPIVQGAPVSKLVDSLTKTPDVAGLLTGGGMPPVPMPPLNLNMTTSSEAKTGAQTASGGFVSHGINFGTTGGNNQLLILGALALAAFFLMRKK
jgi:hypothetical protein